MASESRKQDIQSGESEAQDTSRIRSAVIVFTKWIKEDKESLLEVIGRNVFRMHVLVFVEDERIPNWIMIDPRQRGTRVAYVLSKELQEYCSHPDVVAYRQVVLKQSKTQYPSNALHTCVEAVKRIVGIRADRVITPKQLLRYLDGK